MRVKVTLLEPTALQIETRGFLLLRIADTFANLSLAEMLELAILPTLYLLNRVIGDEVGFERHDLLSKER